MSDTRANSKVGSKLVSRLSSAVFIAAVVVGGWFVFQQVSAPKDVVVESEASAEAAVSADELTLPKGKIEQAKLATEPVSIQKVDHIHTVPGRLAYDEARHIEVKAPVAGVLVDVRVKPGDRVQEGQVLAVVNSPEIGEARAALLNENSRYQLVQKQVERLQEIRKNLKDLFELLDRGVSVDEIEKQFQGRALGDHRGQIVSAYSERVLTHQLAEAARSMAETGSLPARTLKERDNRRHIADATFQSVRESTAFDIGLQAEQLAADQADAQRRVMIARNHLETLLGFADDQTATDSKSLSRLEVRAPFAGTIESRFLAKSERVRQADSLFVLANTDSLYVTADIRENDFAALSVEVGQTVKVIAPAMEDRKFTATVHYVGREVERQSNSLPLTATIYNEGGLLRPGMYVRVSIPVAEAKGVKSVKAGSVLQHENEEFVFVPTGEDTFRRVNVKTGQQNENWVEVVDGLEVGQPVVSDGAFLLKSEMLLAGEE
jgi:cobalt-zinc-cadmium efflux system membrane fusion protein